MTTTDGTHLLAAIAANPDDDTVRLAFADWLDENAGTVECPKCKGKKPRRWRDHSGICDVCNNAGFVHDNRAAQAEFIRVQVELARGISCLDPSIGAVIAGKPAPCYMCRPRNKKDCLPWCESCCRRDDLMNRERELLAHADRWRMGVLAERVETNYDPASDTYRSTKYATAIDSWERGFPAVVILPLAVFLRDAEKRVDVGECDNPKCYKYHRTYVVPTSTTRLVKECPTCHGTGRRTRGDGFAARLLRQVPLRKGGIRFPEKTQDTASFSWCRSDGDLEFDIDPRIFDVMYSLHKHNQRDGDWLYFDTAELAHDTLAVAAWKWAWEQAFGIAPKEIPV